jgi:hypothetical protein
MKGSGEDMYFIIKDALDSEDKGIHMVVKYAKTIKTKAIGFKFF